MYGKSYNLSGIRAVNDVHTPVDFRGIRPIGRRMSLQVEVLKSLTEKLQRSEKSLIKEQGGHPRKDKTFNLIHYMILFNDEEINLLVDLLNRKRTSEIHRGSLPFVNRGHALSVVYDNTKHHWPRSLTGRTVDTLIVDDIHSTLNRKAEIQRSAMEALKARLAKR